jgi:hypothetical protein
MVEADNQLKLLPTSILDLYKVFEHIDMCVDLASVALGLSHGRLSSHRAVLPAPLGAAVNKG